MLTDNDGPSTQDKDNVPRIVTYRLLSEIFARELSAARIAELAHATANGATSVTKNPALAPLFEKLKALENTGDEVEKELAGSFAFLFLGLGGRRSAPPYESVFVSEQGRTNQHPAAHMMRELTLLDLHIKKELPEPADHVAVELATAAAMIEAEATPERQQAFLSDRLNVWLRDFASACERGDRSGFYAIAAHAAANFVAADLNRLATVTSNPIKEMETCNV